MNREKAREIIAGDDRVDAMEREIGCPVHVHPLCQSAGAIGAAVFAWEKYCKKEGKNV